MNLGKVFKNGIIDENPTFVQVIGMCPTLAVTSAAINGLGMGLSTTVVLACSNVAISLLRKVIPDKIRNTSVRSCYSYFRYNSTNAFKSIYTIT